MEEATKNNSELIKILSESQTNIYFPGRALVLNEMSIGKAKNFAIEVVNSVDIFQKESGKDISQMEVSDMLNLYSDIAFKEIARLLNWIFSYKNDDYKELTEEWVANNVTFRMLVQIVNEIARQNQLSWLIPFFREKVQVALQTTAIL